MEKFVHSFEIIRPDFEIEQKASLEWIGRAHEHSEKTHKGNALPEVKERLIKMGFGENKIKKRGLHFGDFFHEKWGEMEIYNVEKSPHGHGLGPRTAFFEKAVSALFERFYPEGTPLPSHLVHVTCTGYTSPSGAQKIVSKRKSSTAIIHAYHMGCYASIPALRIGLGLSGQVDMVHTEMCSLHMNPSRHEVDQLVVQSLFADGFIKYSLSNEAKGFKILSLHEAIIPDSSEFMTWSCHETGMSMTISKEVPFVVANYLEAFFKALCEKAGIDAEEVRQNGFFAIHPGGPKIIEHAAKVLKLRPAQIQHSNEVLYNFGNMSSATLPHIWDKMLKDPNIAKGTLVVSMAFGPGLTMCGALFEKET